MTHEDHQRLLGIITAQSYLLEVAVGSLVARTDDPISAVNTLMSGLTRQIRDDWSKGLHPTGHDVAKLALAHVEQMHQRLLGQFENPLPASSESH